MILAAGAEGALASPYLTDIVRTAVRSPRTVATPLDSVAAPCAPSSCTGTGCALPGAKPYGRGLARRSQRACTFMAWTDSFTAPPPGAFHASQAGPSGT